MLPFEKQLPFESLPFEKEKKKTNWKEDIATSFAGVGNTFDTLGTLAWSLPASEKRKDEMYGNLNQRIKQRNQWANPEEKEQDFSDKVIGTLATLPMSMLAMSASPVETGKTFLDQGESLGRAYGAAGLDMAGNIAGIMLPMPGATKLAKGASNAAINAAQDTATRYGISGMAENETTKKIFDPTWETAALSGIVGAGFGVAQKTAPKKKVVQPKPVSDIEATVASFKKPEVQADPGAKAMENIVESQTTGWNEPVRNNGTGNGMDTIVQQSEAARMAEAQRVIEARQAALEQEVRQRATLDLNAAERQRQQNAPTGYPDWEMEQRMREIDERNQFFERAKQDSIVEDFGNNDPLARMPEMRIDENGIPIRADLSMEAANLENPLQRNLWGDELPYRTGDDGIPLTQALDSMQRGPDREIAIANLRGYQETGRIRDIENSRGIPEDIGRFEGEGGGLGRSQRGAIDISIFNKDYDEYKKLPNGLVLRLRGGSDPTVYAIDTSNPSEPKVISHAKFGRDRYWRPTSPEDNLKASWVHTLPEHQKKGIAQEMYKFVAEKGNDIVPDDVQTPFGKKMWETFERTGLAENNVVTARKNQEGALKLQDIQEGLKKLRERFGGPNDTVRTPISQGNIEAKAQQRVKAQAVADIVKTKLPEYYDPQTFEEASALSREAKDIKSNPYSRSLSSGLNYMATYHNNPLLKYARKLMTDARGAATEFSKKYITSSDGVSPAITKLSPDEKVLVNDLLISLDKHQVDYSTEMADKLNLSDNVRAYMEAHQRAMDAEWEWRKSVTDSQGVNTAPKRSGYSPSVFNGVYNSLVTDGKGKPIGVISANTPGEFMKAKEYYSKTNPEAKFSANTWQQARRSFSGGNHGAFKYRDLGAMIDLLTKADGDFSKVQMQVAKDALQASTDLYNFNVHNMAKKGVTGNIGNKPWLSAKRNAQERLDSVVRFLEEAAEHHALQKPSEELRLLSADDSTSHLPVAKEYLDDYFKNITGSYVNNGGKIINAAFDGVHLAVEEVASHIPGARQYIGPGNTLKLSNTIKNKMSQMYMGWFNWMFTLSQLAQPLQTGAPWLELVANRLDVPSTEVYNSMVKAIAQFARHDLQDYGIIKDLDPRTKQIIEWGRNRGILDFTEIERAYEGHKTKAGRIADNVAEYSMQLGESKTRAPMFLAFVDMLSKREPNLEKVLPVAENLTNQAMADYHRWERPLAYSGLGVLAPHAGGLTTFKHNYMGTQVLLGKEAGKSGMRSKVPIALSVMSMLALGGITGTPFYDEFNTIYEEIREKFTGERRSISQDMLKELPQYLKTGVVSSMLALNMQGKFSSANMVPDSIGKAAFPHLSGAGMIAKDAYTAATEPNSTNVGNLIQSATPSGWKQAANAAVKKDGDWLVDRKGMHDVERTPSQWRNSTVSGLVPLDEAENRNRRFQNIENEKARTDALKQHSVDFKAAVIAGDEEAIGKLLDEYEALGGNPVALIQQIPLIQREAANSSDDRARGIPKSRQGIQRYEAFDN